VTLTNVRSGTCLEGSLNPAAHGTGTVFTEGCTGGAAQEWAVNKAANGGLGLCDVYTRLCLDSNADGDVYANQANGGAYQSWLPNDRHS
jgi:hypothetical protein